MTKPAQKSKSKTIKKKKKKRLPRINHFEKKYARPRYNQIAAINNILTFY